MRFTIWNLLTCTTIFALSIALILSLQRSRSIVIGEYDEFGVAGLFDAAGNAIWTSKWPDKTQPPPVPPQIAYKVARSIANGLEKSRARTGFGSWKIKEISLIPLEGDEEWLYLVCLTGIDYPAHVGINNIQSVRIMILMDGSVIPESSMYTNEIRDAVASHPEVRLADSKRAEPEPPITLGPNNPFSN